MIMEIDIFYQYHNFKGTMTSKIKGEGVRNFSIGTFQLRNIVETHA